MTTERRIALLDVNVLVALFDGSHVHHEEAHTWFGEHRSAGWATTPIVENGFIRVLSHSSYPGRGTSLPRATELLGEFKSSGGHELWPGEISFTDSGRVVPRHVAGHRQVTDVYLLALAVGRRGTLATFDRGISLDAVVGARDEHLTLVGG